MPPAWNRFGRLRSQVGAAIELRDPKAIPRSLRRTMSRMSIFAVQASVEALRHAGIDPAGIPDNPRFGCIMGSTTGSPEAITKTYETLFSGDEYLMLGASEFFRCISHTVALNVAQYFRVKGVVSATSAACASGLQSVGAGYDQILLGRQDVMLCGGAEELHETVVGSFDILEAASCQFNDSPSSTPRPFDVRRDGLVCGDGAGVIVLEEYDHARNRGAKILAEVVGYHTCSNGTHVSQSDDASMKTCMQTAARVRGLLPRNIGYLERSCHRYAARGRRRSQGDSGGLWYERSSEQPQGKHGPYARRFRSDRVGSDVGNDGLRRDLPYAQS